MKRSLSNEAELSLSRYHEIKRNMNLHERKLNSIKPTFISRSPLVKNQRSETKRLAFGEMNRNLTINIENRCLLKKLTDRSHSRISHEKPCKGVKPHARNIMEQRKKTLENLSILKRIKEAKPNYEKKKFLKQRKKTEAYLNTISRFGYKSSPPKNTLPFFQKKQEVSQTNRHRPQRPLPKRLPIGLLGDGLEKIEFICEKKLWGSGDVFELTYIVWESKVAVYGIAADGDTLVLHIPKLDFCDLFGGDLEQMHKCMKYNEEQDSLILDIDPRAPRSHNFPR